MVCGVVAAWKKGKEGVRSGSGGWRLPLRGDGDAVFGKAEGLRAPEGKGVVLDVQFVIKAVG